VIYFSGISTRHLSLWDIPDDNPRFSSVEDCYRLFLGLHLRMMRGGTEKLDPYYNRYLACVEHFDSHLILSYQEFRNVVGTIVDFYRQYFDSLQRKQNSTLLDTIGKFERLIYMFSNKTFPTQTAQGGK
jgi:hypothetical protein